MAYTSMVDYMLATIGPNWVVARRSPRIVERYGEDVVCLSQARYATLKALFDAQAPSAENAARAMLTALRAIESCLRPDDDDAAARAVRGAITQAEAAGI